MVACLCCSIVSFPLFTEELHFLLLRSPFIKTKQKVRAVSSKETNIKCMAVDEDFKCKSFFFDGTMIFTC